MINITLPKPNHIFTFNPYKNIKTRKDRDAVINTLCRKFKAKYKGVYLFYCDNNELLYVGRSHNINNRVKQHVHDSPFFENVARIEIIYIEGEPQQEIYETYAIWKLNPKYNVRKKEVSE